MTKKFWVSWYGQYGAYTLHWPWWISGYRIAYRRIDDEVIHVPTICAAILAPSEEAAKEIIFAAHDVRPQAIEWRFCAEQPDDWTPFNERFPKANWMPDFPPGNEAAR